LLLALLFALPPGGWTPRVHANNTSGQDEGDGPCPPNTSGVGEPSEDQPETEVSEDPVSLRRGSSVEGVVDLAVPGPLFDFQHWRTYDSRNTAEATSAGERWLCASRNAYLLENGSNIELHYSSTNKRTFTGPPSSGVYTAPTGWRGKLEKKTNQNDDKDYDGDGVTGSSDTIDYFILTMFDEDEVLIFAGFDADVASEAQGRLVERTTRTYQAAGKRGIRFKYDPSGYGVDIATTAEPQSWEIDYTYKTSGFEAGYLDKIEAYNGIISSGAVVQKVEYRYFGDTINFNTDLGDFGDLIGVKQSQLGTNGVWLEQYTHYRYYTSGSSDGKPHQLKAVFEPVAVERMMGASASFDTTSEIEEAADADVVAGGVNLAGYASRSFTYYTNNLDTGSAVSTPFGSDQLESDYGGSNDNEYNATNAGHVRTETINGSCSGCGASDGTIIKTYFYLLQNASPTNSNVVEKIVIEDVDADATADNGNEVHRKIYGLNNLGVALREALIEDPDAGSLKMWCRSIKIFDSAEPKLDGRFKEKRLPSVHNDSVFSNATLKKFLDPSVSNNDTETIDDASGLIYSFNYLNLNGMKRIRDVFVQKGESGTARPISVTDFGDADDNGNGTVGDGQGKDKDDEYLPILIGSFRSVPAHRNVAERIDVKYAYEFWDSADTQIKRVTATLPIVASGSSGENGSGVATAISRYFDKLGRLRWTQDGEGYINYYSYHPKTGGLAYVAVDVDPASMPADASTETDKRVAATDDGIGSYSTGKPTRGSLPTALALVTKYEYDDLGRVRKAIDPNSHVDFVAYEAIDYYDASRLRVTQFPAWTGTAATGPIKVTLYNGAYVPLSRFKFKGNSTSITIASSAPTGIGSAPLADYKAWTNFTYHGVNGQLQYVDRYWHLPASAPGTLDADYYRTALRYDARGRRQYVIQQVSGEPTSNGVEQVTKLTYDALNRVTKVERGVSDAATNIGATYANLPTLAKIAEIEFDGAGSGAGIGDSYVTAVKSFYGTGSNDFVQRIFKRTYRGHLRGVDLANGASAFGPVSVADVDWKGRPVKTASYTSAPSWSSVLTSEGYTDFIVANGTNRFKRVDRLYDVLDRIYRTERYPGVSVNKLQTNYYYDRNQRLVCAGDKYSAHAEYAYDGAGRKYQERVVADVAATTYLSGQFQYCAPAPHRTLGSMPTNGDEGLIRFSHAQFDAASNVIGEHQFELNHNDANGIDIDSTNSYVRRTVYRWYDAADRMTDEQDYGAGNGGATNSWNYATVPTRNSSVTNWSSSVVRNGYALRTSYLYNAAGRLESIDQGVFTDGDEVTRQKTKLYYDDLGRRPFVVENDDGTYNPVTGTPASSADYNRTTGWKFNGLNRVTELAAYNSNGDAQTTKHFFIDPYNASLRTNAIYPDSLETTPALQSASPGFNQVRRKYALDGRLIQLTDQNGTVHDYTYNNRRQLEIDAATSLGTNIDGFVRSIKRTFNNRGQVETISSYDAAGTTVRNQIEYAFDSTTYLPSLGKQHHATPAGGSPLVQWETDQDVDNGTDKIFTGRLRRTRWIYPNGASVELLRNDSLTQNGWLHDNSLSDRLGRIAGVTFDADGAGAGAPVTESAYQYCGTRRLIATDYQAPDVRREMFNSGTPTNYDAFDRFGATLRQQWDDYTGSPATTRDRFNYTRDLVGDPLSRDIPSALYATNNRDETYAYDGLLRLKQSNDGTYSSGMIADASAKLRQKWSLDALGNWSAFQQDGLPNYTTLADNDFADATDIDQTRDHNKANEIDDDEIDGNTPTNTISVAVAQDQWRAPEYDRAGSMRVMPRSSSTSLPHLLVYDAWNRLVEVKTTTATVQKNKYDGLHRRIVKEKYVGGSPNETRHYYYNTAWQVVEERLESSGTINANPINQYVWNPEYVDSLALRRYDSNTDGTAEGIYYYLHDANYNVTAVVNSSGAVVERYAYSSYGVPLILNGASDADSGVSDFSVDGDQVSDVDNNYLYTGRERDAETGLQNSRFRFFASHLGRWLQRDPIGYRGGSNLYGYVGGMPNVHVDPNGLAPIPLPPEGEPPSGGGGGWVPEPPPIRPKRDCPTPEDPIHRQETIEEYTRRMIEKNKEHARDEEYEHRPEQNAIDDDSKTKGRLRDFLEEWRRDYNQRFLTTPPTPAGPPPFPIYAPYYETPHQWDWVDGAIAAPVVVVVALPIIVAAPIEIGIGVGVGTQLWPVLQGSH
jgi:RHS repeat-associated protein